MRIALGCDHRGAEAITRLRDHLAAGGHEPSVVGPCDGTPCDYPDQAWLVARAVSEGRAGAGVLICGSGIGMSMAANKVPGVRAALAFDARAAEMSRRHNDANVLCLDGDGKTIAQVLDAADVFLATSFEGGRHARRVSKLAAIERGEDPASREARAAGV